MKTKLIGLTARVLYEDGVKKQFVNERYLTPLINRGFNTIMLTLDNIASEEILSLCDGFLITGGYDLDPTLYGESNTGESENCNPSLDILDKEVVNYAVKNKKPILGICRGHQSINVFLGGTLYQHIENHRGIKGEHDVETISNKLLSFNQKIETNSYHHQSVKDLAPGLIEVAHHIDGTNEAFIHESLPIIGIQWHPEILADSSESKIIFDSFKNLVNKEK